MSEQLAVLRRLAARGLAEAETAYNGTMIDLWTRMVDEIAQHEKECAKLQEQLNEYSWSLYPDRMGR